MSSRICRRFLQIIQYNPNPKESPFLPEALKEEKVAKAARSEEAGSQTRPKSDIKCRSNSN